MNEKDKEQLGRAYEKMANRSKIDQAKANLRAIAERVMVKVEQIEGRTMQLTTDKRRLFPWEEKLQILGALDEVVDLIVEYLRADGIFPGLQEVLEKMEPPKPEEKDPPLCSLPGVEDE